MGYKNILLVDDDSDDAELFSMAMHTIDEKLICVIENDAIRALKNLKNTKEIPDVIFLDINMPTLSGNGFLELIRLEDSLKDIPVVLYSGHSDEALKSLAKNAEKTQFLSKPSKYRDLVESLRKIVG